MDPGKLREKVNAAIEVYIYRVDGAPCGETPIPGRCYMKGANDESVCFTSSGTAFKPPNIPSWLKDSQGAVEKFKFYSISVL